MRTTLLASLTICLAAVCGELSAATTSTFLSPRGGEVFVIGQTYQLTLQLGRRSRTIAFELSRDGGNTFSRLGQATVISRQACLLWDAAGPASIHCLVRAVGSDGIIISYSDPFSISDGLATPASVTAAAMAPQAVTTAKLVDGIITSAMIPDNSVTAPKFNSDGASLYHLLTTDGNGGVYWDKLHAEVFPTGAAGGCLSGEFPNPTLRDGIATAPNFADQGVTTPKFVDQSVTNAKLADNSIADSKVASGAAAAGQVLSADGAGKTTWIDLPAQMLNLHDHNQLSNLGNDDHPQYALKNGRATGQRMYGSTVAGGVLRLDSTSHATKGIVSFGMTGDNVGIGGITALSRLHIKTGADDQVGFTLCRNSATQTANLAEFRTQSVDGGYPAETVLTKIAKIGTIDFSGIGSNNNVLWFKHACYNNNMAAGGWINCGQLDFWTSNGSGNGLIFENGFVITHNTHWWGQNGDPAFSARPVAGQTAPIFQIQNDTGATTYLQVNNKGITSFYDGGDVASAANLVPSGNTTSVTGTTAISTIDMANLTAGTKITLVFASAGVVVNSNAGIKVSGGSFTSTANSTLTLVFLSSTLTWYEISRSRP